MENNETEKSEILNVEELEARLEMVGVGAELPSSDFKCECKIEF